MTLSKDVSNGQMLKTKEIPSVYTDFPKNKQGFTMISSLFTLIIISLTLPLFIYLLQSTYNYTTNHEQFSIQHFFLFFLQDEMKHSTDYNISNNQLQLSSSTGDLISFQLQGELVIRKVNQKGYEVYLRNTDKIYFSPNDYGMKVSITTNKGEQYEKQIIYYE